MSTTAIAIVVVVVVVVVLAAIGAVVLVNRRRALHRRYGQEYDRAIEEAGSRRAGEADLRERVAAHDKLPIHPLSHEQADRYREEWQRVQAEFVDAPSGSLRHADAVVTAVMADSGYPMSDFDQQANIVSVDHPSVVENYRRAHATYVNSERDPVGTDELREAIVAYRSLFDELVATESDGGAADREPSAAPARGPMS